MIDAKRRRGRCNQLSGAAAETSVADDYSRRGRPVIATRWRGQGGEIDLIARDGTGYIFIEVKKGPDHDTALTRVTPRQMQRVRVGAEECGGTLPGGSLTDMRFDVATVDAHGHVKIHENAFAGF